MAEPSLGVLGGVAAGVTVGAAWAGLDLNAVMGALAGSLLFVLFAPDLSIYKRIGYFLVSLVAGYYGSAELIGVGAARTSGGASFMCAALVVTISITILEWIRGGKMPEWLRSLLDRRGGGSNG